VTIAKDPQFKRWLSGALMMTLLSCYLYYFMEWLFFITRPSLFSYLTPTEQLGILFNAPLPLVALCLPMVLFTGLVSVWLSQNTSISRNWLVRIPLLIPALILTFMTLLMLDNFSYTLFDVASFSYNGLAVKGYYWGLLLLFSLYFLNKLSLAVSVGGHFDRQPQIFGKCLLVLSCLSLVSLTLSVGTSAPTAPLLVIPKAKQQALPNILFFGSDGVNGSHMSVYGYERQTTPFMDSIAEESLVFGHHWTNSAKTTGAIGALLSGKFPTRTRVIFRPDTFRGEDMFQHLPGLLRQLGYYNIDISMRHYIDSADLKMRHGFHYANKRYLDDDGPLAKSGFLKHWPETTLFLEESGNRLYQRLAHLSGLSPMVNPFKLVNQGQEIPAEYSDINRMTQLKQQLLQAPRPFFANVHLLGSHGGKFDYERAIFTNNKQQPDFWMVDHYDNAIYQWDAYAQEMYKLLEDMGELDNTLMVFSSDHAWQHRIDETLPLIIRLPKGEVTGYVDQASQSLDIAPTVLEYLGITPPVWMDGNSLLSRSEQPYPIFIVGTKNTKTQNAGDWKVAANLAPPFYSLGTISMAYCGMLYSLELNDIQHTRLTQKRVHRKTGNCPEVEFDSQTAASMLIAHLKSMGYDVGRLTDRFEADSRLRQ
jgi:arylsulfatase A-like enzyme